MTPQQAAQLVPILTAYAEGKVVQYQCGEEGRWYDFKGDDLACDEPYLFGNERTRWRIKPSPREFWICPLCWTINKHRVPDHQHLPMGESPTPMVHVREVLL